jgi:predicted unusual protein kinase regulating ubiquinone biosynthesis (AarF/ABC1/UbiB family)
MPTRLDLPPALRTAVDAGVAMARHAPTTKVLLARLAGLLDGVTLPRRVTAEIEAATQAALVPLEPKVVERTLKDAWGAAPGKVLDALERDPLAVRGAAQIHAGELDGRPVAVKVLRPGLAAAVRTDLSMLDALGPPLRAAFPAAGIGEILVEIREGAMDELDLEHEADTQRLVGRALRGTGGVTVPAVHGELSAENVLVTDLLDGPTLAEAQPDDPGEVAAALLRAHVQTTVRAGLVLTDARPGHVVLLSGGGIGLLGAGVARPWPAERLQGLLDSLAALRNPDGADDLAALAERFGVTTADEARAAHPLLREILGDLITGAARLDHDSLAAAADRAAAAIGRLFAIGAHVMLDPADIGAIRGAGQLVATLAVLGATEDWVALARDAATAR